MAISDSMAPVPRWYRLDSRRGFLVSGLVAVGAVVPLMCGSTAATTAPSAAQWPSSLFLLPVLVAGAVRDPSGSTAGPSGSTVRPTVVPHLSQVLCVDVICTSRTQVSCGRYKSYCLPACHTCWKYALEAIIKGLLLYFLVHDNCLLFML